MVEIPFCLDKNNLINDLKIISWEAADILIHYSQEIKVIENKSKIIKNKGKNNPVTLADLKVNEMVIQRIREKFSEADCNILSEESDSKHNNNCIANNDWLWVLDPLDGTKDFIQGTGNYAMHLALNYKNKPFLGLVLIPSKNELWITNGDMVWCERKNNSSIQPKISSLKNLNEMRIVTSNNHRNDVLEKLISKIDFRERILMGSIGCKIASILRGDSDIYICLSLPGESSPKDWDFCAPAVTLMAAGGAITNLDNQELIYGKTNFEQGGIIIASSNKINHKNICSEIKNIINKYNLYPFEIN